MKRTVLCAVQNVRKTKKKEKILKNELQWFSVFFLRLTEFEMYASESWAKILLSEG